LSVIHASLRDPITEGHAQVLRAIVEKRESVDTFVKWVSQHADLSWAAFNDLVKRQEDKV
jgi:hypothetical protein